MRPNTFLRLASVMTLLLAPAQGENIEPAVATITDLWHGFPPPKPADSLTPIVGYRSYDFLRMRYDDLWMRFEYITREVTGVSVHGREIATYRFCIKIFFQ